jgi:hypothetical protein
LTKTGFLRKGQENAQKAYVEQKEAVKSAKAGLAMLDKTSKGSGKLSKKSKKAKEAEAKSKEADGATKLPKDPMKAYFQANLEKAKKAAEDAKGTMTTLQARCSRSMPICFLSRASTRGTISL